MLNVEHVLDRYGFHQQYSATMLISNTYWHVLSSGWQGPYSPVLDMSWGGRFVRYGYRFTTVL